MVRTWRPPSGRLRRRLYEDHLTHVPFSYLELARGDDDVAQALYPTDALAAARWTRRTGRPSVFSLMGILDPPVLVARRPLARRGARAPSAAAARRHASADGGRARLRALARRRRARDPTRRGPRGLRARRAAPRPSPVDLPGRDRRAAQARGPARRGLRARAPRAPGRPARPVATAGDPAARRPWRVESVDLINLDDSRAPGGGLLAGVGHRPALDLGGVRPRARRVARVRHAGRGNRRRRDPRGGQLPRDRQAVRRSTEEETSRCARATRSSSSSDPATAGAPRAAPARGASRPERCAERHEALYRELGA